MSKIIATIVATLVLLLIAAIAPAYAGAGTEENNTEQTMLAITHGVISTVDGETNITVSVINGQITQALALKISISWDLSATTRADNFDIYKPDPDVNEGVWFKINQSEQKDVVYHITSTQPTLTTGSVYRIRVDLLNQNGIIKSVEGKIVVQDIVSYYRSHGENSGLMETSDALEAANHWSMGIKAPGFSRPITTSELLLAINEWQNSN